MSLELLWPDWPAPTAVNACITTRVGGVSSGAYTSLNLGDHVGDDPAAVVRNRARLAARLALPGEPLWLHQVHGCDVAEAGRDGPGCTADAAVTCRTGRVCAVLTADCLPLLFCDRNARCVAAVHAGWRGLRDGVIEAALDALGIPAARLLCWLGPAIGPRAFEVGAEVRDGFLERDPGAAGAFRPSPGGRWLADLYTPARRRLAARGVGYVGGGDFCTLSDARRFFSFRRDGRTGRMASLIWLE